MMLLLYVSVLSLIGVSTPLTLQREATTLESPGRVNIPQVNGNSELGATGGTCAPPRGDYAHSVEVYYKDCAEAIGKTRSEGTLDFLLLRPWTTESPAAGQEGVPQYWQYTASSGRTCYMIVDGPRRRETTLLSLAAMTHYGSVILNSCLKPILPGDTGMGFGGRYSIADQGFYIDIAGNLPSSAQPYVNKGGGVSMGLNETETFFAN